MRNLYLFLITIFLLSCSNKQEHINFPTIVPSQNFDTIIKTNSKKMNELETIVHSINKNDTIDLNSRENYKSEDYTEQFPNSTKTDSIKVFVDTSYQKFHTTSFHISKTPIPPPPLTKPIDSISKYNIASEEYKNNEAYISFLNTIDSLEKTHYESYPLFIYNSSSSKRIIQAAYGFDLFFILEAQDKDGSWKPIEYLYQYRYTCGTGHHNYTLKPKSFLTSSVKKYHGNFQTKLRVKFRNFDKTYYSNVFEGTINYSQFNTANIVEDIKTRFSSQSQDEINTRIQRAFLNW